MAAPHVSKGTFRTSLDTRTKIISATDVSDRLRGQPARWVSGHFDPLLAEHVRLLGKSTAPNQLLVVTITNPSQPLLAQRARAELVAALAMVDYVVLENSAAANEAVDATLTEQFIERVHRRNNPGRPG